MKNKKKKKDRDKKANKKYFIFTLGCQMNESDSERMEKLLEEAGFKKGKEENSDLIIVNACSVRQKPIDRIWGKLKKWKKENPEAQLFLTGCVTDQDRKKLKKRFDWVFSIEDLDEFAKKIGLEIEAGDYLEIEPDYKYRDKAFVPIMTGCNNFCSYCVVPYTRGRERSRDPENILKEVKCLIGKGYKKIVLLGQNVNSYRIEDKKSLKKKKQSSDFVKLLKKVNDIKGDFTIGFLTSHPKDMGDDLIETIAELEKLENKVHLPVQSGDNEILKKMNRGYTRDDYLKLVKKLKEKVDDLNLSTDIIVGFPGETKEQFQNTVELAKKVNFDKAYISKYSKRPSTRASKFKDNIPLKEKKRRFRVLDRIINE